MCVCVCVERERERDEGGERRNVAKLVMKEGSFRQKNRIVLQRSTMGINITKMNNGQNNETAENIPSPQNFLRGFYFEILKLNASSFFCTFAMLIWLNGRKFRNVCFGMLSTRIFTNIRQVVSIIIFGFESRGSQTHSDQCTFL